MKSSKEISRFDKAAYKTIRKNISAFLKKASEDYDGKKKLILDIAPQIHNDTKKFFKKSKIEILDINKGNNIDYVADITKNNSDKIKSGSYDVVICTEVLEHVENPFKAISEVSRILKRGGVLLLSAPLNFRIHGPLPDCWRFTQYGLKVLLADFKIIKLRQVKTKERPLMPIHYTVIARK